MVIPAFKPLVIPTAESIVNLFLISLSLGEYAVQLARALSLENRVKIILNDRELAAIQTGFPGFFQGTALETVPLPPFRFFDPRKMPRVSHYLKLIKNHATDLIYVTIDIPSPELVTTMWLCNRRGLPLVGAIHDTRPHPGDNVSVRHAWLQLKAIELCDQLIVHSRALAEDLSNVYGLDERTINIVPHGNYDMYLHAGSQPPTAKAVSGRVLLFGRMLEYKGIDVLVKAAYLAREKAPELKIVLAGRGPELDRLEPHLRSSPDLFEVRNRFVPVSEVAELFTSANLVVIPYLEASQSGPLHLAFTFGRPVVASRVGAIPETVDDGHEGLLVTPGDPAALAGAMVRIIQNPELAARMGQAARKKAAEELDWDKGIKEQTRAVFQKAVDNKLNNRHYPGIDHRTRWKRIKEIFTTRT